MIIKLTQGHTACKSGFIFRIMHFWSIPYATSSPSNKSIPIISFSAVGKCVFSLPFVKGSFPSALLITFHPGMFSFNLSPHLYVQSSPFHWLLPSQSLKLLKSLTPVLSLDISSVLDSLSVLDFAHLLSCPIPSHFPRLPQARSCLC